MNAIPTTAVRLGEILREDAGTANPLVGRTIAACRATLDDEATSRRARDEVRKYLDELLETESR